MEIPDNIKGFHWLRQDKRKMVGNEEKQDVDKGFAWVVLAGCFGMYFFVVGSIKSYGILYTEIDQYFAVGSGPLAFIGSVIFLCMLGLGPFANYLAVKISFRTMAFIGGILLGVGYASSCLVDRMEYLFITFGICAGLGYGLAFAPCSTIISYYFEKRRALANGITVSASGIGAIGFPFLYRFLIQTYTLRPALLIVGGMLLNVCVAACFFRQPQILVKLKQMEQMKRKAKKKKKDALLNGEIIHDKNDEKEDETCCSCGPDFKFSLFKKPRFTLYALAFMIAMNGYGNNLILIPSHTLMMGYDKASVALTVSILGGCEVVARIFFGWFADQDWISRKHIFLLSFLLSSVFAFVTPQFKSLTYMCVYSAIIGIFPGSFWSLMSVLIIDVVGLEDFPSAFGLISLCLALGAAISQPCIALLKDKTGNWEASFYLTGVLLLIPALMFLMEPLVFRCERKLEKRDSLDAIDAVPLRRETRKPSQRTSQKDSDSLLDDDPDVSFTSERISRVYRSFKRENSEPRTPERTSAPIARADDV